MNKISCYFILTLMGADDKVSLSNRNNYVLCRANCNVHHENLVRWGENDLMIRLDIF